MNSIERHTNLGICIAEELQNRPNQACNAQTD